MPSPSDAPICRPGKCEDCRGHSPHAALALPGQGAARRTWVVAHTAAGSVSSTGLPAGATGSVHFRHLVGSPPQRLAADALAQMLALTLSNFWPQGTLLYCWVSR